MKEFEKWLQKSLNDLNSAVKLIQGETPITDTAIYHTQQCAKKALKSFLAFHQQVIQKSHDLDFLIDFCVAIDSDFEKLRKYAQLLNAYSTEFRYSGDEMEPELEDVLEAIKISEIFYKTVSIKTSK